MIKPLPLLIGHNSLRNKIARESELLQIDRARVEAKREALKLSFRDAATSPLTLAATGALGFVMARRWQRPPKKIVYKEKTAKTHSPWWELMLPLGITWARHFISTRQSHPAPAAPSPDDPPRYPT